MSINARGQFQAQGRPSEYHDGYIDKVYEYCDKYRQLDQVVPTMQGLCCYIRKNLDTVYRWAKDEDKVNFSEALKYLLNIQANVLQNSGLRGEFNSTITKLMLSSNHGMRETQSVETTQNINITQSIDIKEAARMIDFMMSQAKQITHEDGTTTINQPQE